MNAAYFTPENPIHGASDWFVAQVDYFSSKVEGGVSTQAQIIDNRDPEHPLRTVGDDVHEIALKCFLILIGLPIYTVGVMATHAVRCFTLVTSNLVTGEFSEAFLSLVQEVWAVAKAPIYGLAIEFYAIPGIIFPLTMRSVIAQLERDWSGSERKYDMRKTKTQEECEAGLGDYFTNRTSKITAFLAFCFQPIGELNDSDRVRSYRVKTVL